MTTTPVSQTDISLQGWDTANVVTFAVANQAIAAGQKLNPPSFPPTFQWTDPDVNTETITGVWGPWSITPEQGDGGQLIHMKCPIVSGTATVGAKSIDLAGGYVVILVTLQNVRGTAFVDHTAQPPGPGVPAPTCVAIVTNPQPKTVNDGDHDTTPAVSVVALSDGIPRNPFQFLFEDWMNANVQLFHHVFHAAMLGELIAEAAGSTSNPAQNPLNQQWMKPTAVTYTTAVYLNGTDGIFAALCQTDGDADPHASAQIDSQIMDSLSAGANAVFAISGEKVAEHLLKPGAQSVMLGSSLEDFDIIGDGLVVTNNKDVTWRQLVLDDGTNVTAVVPKGQFTLKIIDNQLELDFVGVTFQTQEKVFWCIPAGHLVFEIDFTQRVGLQLQKRSDGTCVLVPEPYDPTNPSDIQQFSMSAHPDAVALSTQQWMEIAAIGLSILPACKGLASGVGKILSKAVPIEERMAQFANTAEKMGFDADEIAAMNRAGSAASTTPEAASVRAAVAASNTIMPPQVATIVNRFSIASGVLAGVAGVGLGSIELDQVLQMKLSDVPSFDQFLANALSSAHWPSTQSFTIQNIVLAQSLLVYGTLT
jgi:hypothetical protein